MIQLVHLEVFHGFSKQGVYIYGRSRILRLPALLHTLISDAIHEAHYPSPLSPSLENETGEDLGQVFSYSLACIIDSFCSVAIGVVTYYHVLYISYKKLIKILDDHK